MTLRWTPQRTADWALVVSGLSILGCLLLALWPVERRRRRRHAHAAGGGEPGAARGPTIRRRSPPWPTTSAPPPGPLHLRGAAGVAARRRGDALVAGGVAAAIAQPLAGAAVGVATLVVLLVPRLRVLLALAAVACVAGAGIYVAVHQLQTVSPDNGAWPQSFGTASRWAWAGVVLLGADGAVDVALRARRRRLDRRPADPPVASDTV